VNREFLLIKPKNKELTADIDVEQLPADEKDCCRKKK
jgi:hypothetical protein